MFIVKLVSKGHRHCYPLGEYGTIILMIANIDYVILLFLTYMCVIDMGIESFKNFNLVLD